MFDSSTSQDQQRKRSDRRTNPRYRLSPSPEVELLHGSGNGPVKARLGDLSRGGCYIETDCEIPVETEVTVTLKNSGDHVTARARVVRAAPQKGLALEFTYMEGEAFRILDQWLSVFVVTSWVMSNRRRTQRVAMEIEVQVSGYTAEGTRFTENTRTVEISGFGGLVILGTPVNRGQRLVLSNPLTNVTVECMVAHREAKSAAWHVGLAFTVLNQPFWPIDLPPAD